MTDQTRSAASAVQNDSIQGKSACPRCKTVFECGARAGSARCWCFDLPAVAPTGAGAQCLCPACLAAEARAQASGATGGV